MKYKYLLLIVPVFMLCLSSCKKDKQVTPAISLIGKWLIKKHKAVFLKDGSEIGNSVITTFGPYDFAQYFDDGSGVLSANTTTSSGIVRFNYSLNGTNLIQYDYPTGSAGIPETITKLSEYNLSIHYELFVVDPDDTGAIYKEIHDFDFVRGD